MVQFEKKTCVPGRQTLLIPMISNKFKSMNRRQFLKTSVLTAGTSLCLSSTLASAANETSKGYRQTQQNTRPNILWIVTEDQSPHLSCYGETAIKTPNIDALAKDGVRFENAFVTCPVCSPSRSAMVTGIYQTTLGTHNHRSQRPGNDRDGNPNYTDSYRLPNKSVPQLFREAGYYVVNIGKTDYNWPNQRLYNRGDWSNRRPGQPFFAQHQLVGGKGRGARVPNPVDSNEIKLPPYYPEHPVMRQDWADYLNSWIQTDIQVGRIIGRLKKEGLFENTVIFFLTDHGISSMRGKQYLYEEGIRIPMIVRFPGAKMAGTVRKDSVLQIDMAAASLALAGIEIPKYIQGKNIFAKDYKLRDFVVTARDRCGDPIDTIRSVRKGKLKYIRNFISYRPHSQRDQYKDAKDIIRILRKLHAENKLTELQGRFFNPTRPPEELYDLEKDPYETVNLAGRKQYLNVLLEMRKMLYEWMIESRDLGLIPEPILEDMGEKYGHKSYILRDKKNSDLVKRLIEVVEAGELKDLDKLRKLLTTGSTPEKYWAITWLGLHQDGQSIDSLKKFADDNTPAIRVAACLAMCKLAQSKTYLPKLIPEISNPNHLVQMYAMNAIEQTGILNDTVKKAAKIACKSKYDNTVRYGRRLLTKFGKASPRFYDEYVPERYEYLYQPYKPALPYPRSKP